MNQFRELFLVPSLSFLFIRKCQSRWLRYCSPALLMNLRPQEAHGSPAWSKESSEVYRLVGGGGERVEGKRFGRKRGVRERAVTTLIKQSHTPSKSFQEKHIHPHTPVNKCSLPDCWGCTITYGLYMNTPRNQYIYMYIYILYSDNLVGHTAVQVQI